MVAIVLDSSIHKCSPIREVILYCINQVLAGEYIEFRPETGEQLKRKTMISATSPALLTLCGDMRCYRLLETPLEDHLKVFYGCEV